MTKEIKNAINDNKVVRWFLRSLTGCILINNTIYAIVKLWTVDQVPFGTNAWILTIGSLATWAAWEASLKFLNRKLGE
jgi:hypothetical protein